ncbi:hypothetical protein [Moheibacter sediminis]|uniref:Uncharacterized protein n=1 Tax=Moheibacter sediminis TaxID=1434700 RepID=A0A1W1YM76_9FLAO|nr:hypothetical protein [Moheibacter sediminis]SMC37340.1 hypothetical protein SAMN06296427_101553 [Moheibacter sediminis]
MKLQLFKYKFILILIILNSCQNNIKEIFVDDKIEKLFVEYLKEVEASDYRDGDKIFIKVYSKKSNEDWCMSFINSEFYSSEDNYRKFNYKGFKVYVNQNVPQSIISLDDYKEKVKFKFEGIPSKKEFLKTYICFERDSTIVQRVNFEKKEYLNTWKKLE